jgi:hypothetical protein
MSWYSMILLVVVCLLIMLVIRLSEISTRLHTLDSVTTRIVEDSHTMSNQIAEFVTHQELHMIMRHSSPSYFTVGR